MKTILVAIIGMLALAGCKTSSEPVTPARLPKNVVEITVLAKSYQYQGKTLDAAALKIALTKDKAMLKKRGSLIKVSGDAKESRLVYVLDQLSGLGITDLNVMTLKKK
jgi:biopolymer transport protein ExbD